MSNPLQQYFRRPAIHLTLPSGGHQYSSDVLELPPTGQLPVYPMTANDEIISRTPDALFNGSAVVSVIQSCVPAIKNAWLLSSVDLEAVMMSIRIATNGEEMDIDTTCPECSEESRYGINLSVLSSQIKVPDYNQELRVGELLVKFKPMTYQESNIDGEEQFIIQRTMTQLNTFEDGPEKNKLASELLAKMSALGMKLITRTIEYIRTPETSVTDSKYILDFLNNCDKRMYETIRDHSTNLRDQSTLKPIKISCQHCQHKYEQSLAFNLTDFFA